VVRSALANAIATRVPEVAALTYCAAAFAPLVKHRLQSTFAGLDNTGAEAKMFTTSSRLPG